MAMGSSGLAWDLRADGIFTNNDTPSWLDAPRSEASGHAGARDRHDAGAFNAADPVVHDRDGIQHAAGAAMPDQRGGAHGKPGGIDLTADDLFGDEIAAQAATSIPTAQPAGPGADGAVDLTKIDLTMLAPTDEQYFDLQWHLASPGGYNINVVDVWDDYTGAGVKVAVLDQGIDASHVDLNDNYDFAAQYSSVNGSAVGTPQTSNDNHGTAVGGVIGAEVNGEGVVGIAYEADLVSIYSPLSGTVGQLMSQATNAFNYYDNYDILNNSWGFGNYFYYGTSYAFVDNFDVYTAPGNALANAIANGRDGLGAIVTFAAGNTGLYGDDVNLHSFQNSRFTIAAGATQENGEIASFSTPGAAVLVSAPGVSIATTDRSGSAGYVSSDYVYISGTSFSSPATAGVVALMLEANPGLGWRDVQEILAYSSRVSDDSDPTWRTNGANDWNGGGLHVSDFFGYGLIDAEAAVRLAESWAKTNTLANEVSLSGTSAPSLAIPDTGPNSSSPTAAPTDRTFHAANAVSDTITITEDIRVNHVEVDLNISHTRIGDLMVRLVSPDGTESLLLSQAGKGSLGGFGSTQSGVNFTFTSVFHWGESSVGDWRLEVADLNSYGSASGTLVDWTLVLYGEPASADQTLIMTDEFAAMLAADPSRGTWELQEGQHTLNLAAVTTDVSLNLNLGADNVLDTANAAATTFTFVAEAGVALAGPPGIASAKGGKGSDVIVGNDLDNTFDGGNGADTISGGNGNDVIGGGNGADVLNGDDGDDTLSGNNGPDTLNGGDGVDTLIGGNGDDWLDGGLDGDWLAGGLGDDTYFVDDSGDSITEFFGEGSDSVFTTVSFALRDHSQFLEKLTLTGSDDIDGTGNGRVNTITGNDGDNILNGAWHNDTLIGGAGNDTFLDDQGSDRFIGGLGDDVYFVDDAGDRIVEYEGEGIELVNASVSFALRDHSQFLEKLTLTGSDDIDGTGNGRVNTITGNDGDNILNGAWHNDTLIGGAGNDTFEDDEGDDFFIGGTGSDRFVWSEGVDTVVDYSKTEGDVLVLQGAGNTFVSTATGTEVRDALDNLIMVLDGYDLGTDGTPIFEEWIV